MSKNVPPTKPQKAGPAAARQEPYTPRASTMPRRPGSSIVCDSAGQVRRATQVGAKPRWAQLRQRGAGACAGEDQLHGDAHHQRRRSAVRDQLPGNAQKGGPWNRARGQARRSSPHPRCELDRLAYGLVRAQATCRNSPPSGRRLNGYGASLPNIASSPDVRRRQRM